MVVRKSKFSAPLGLIVASRLCDKLKVANKSQHRLFRKQRRGQKQATMKLEGKQLKRERMVSSQSLALSELELQELLA